MAASLIALVLSCFEITSATLSYRSDGPNVEYKSLRDLERTPFLLGDGSWYRDRLTIEASKAVGQFAQNHHFQPYSQPVRLFSSINSVGRYPKEMRLFKVFCF